MPSGDRGAVLTASGDVEIWSLGEGEPRLVRAMAAPTGTQGVLWGAGDVVVATGKETLRFWGADTGETVGDHQFGRDADAELPLHWGRFDVWPDARTAIAKARIMSPDVWALRRAVRETAG